MLMLEQAAKIATATIQRARELGAAPMTVAVLDVGGHLVVLNREDHSGILRPQIAIAKAWGALGLGINSRELSRRAQVAPHLFSALSAASDGRLVPVPGGVLIRRDGVLIGAVGVSGDTSDLDEACAVFAVSQTGLAPDPGLRTWRHSRCGVSAGF